MGVLLATDNQIQKETQLITYPFTCATIAANSHFTKHNIFFDVSIDQSYFTVTVILGSGYIYSVNTVGTSHNMYAGKTASKHDIMMTLMRVRHRWSCVDMGHLARATCSLFRLRASVVFSAKSHDSQSECDVWRQITRLSERV